MSEPTIKGMKARELKALYEETIGDINEIKKALEFIEEKKNVASKANIEILGEDEAGNGLLQKIQTAVKTSKEKLGLIQEVFIEIYGDEENDDESIKAKLEELLTDFDESERKINSLKRELEGYTEKTEEGEKKVPGLMDNINSFHDAQKKKYKELFDQIEIELLAGATTVGLAKAYTDKANSYKEPNQLWLYGFFASIGIIIFILFDAISIGWINDRTIYDLFFAPDVLDIEGVSVVGSSNSINNKLLEYLIIKLLVNVGIISSLIWIANFTGKQYNQNKRLAEEYSYKATFARSFEGYRRKAEEIEEGEEHKEVSLELMKKMVEMSAFNPVKTMESKSHKENHPTMKMLEESMETINKSISVIEKIEK